MLEDVFIPDRGKSLPHIAPPLKVIRHPAKSKMPCELCAPGCPLFIPSDKAPEPGSDS